MDEDTFIFGSTSAKALFLNSEDISGQVTLHICINKAQTMHGENLVLTWVTSEFKSVEYFLLTGPH